MSNMIPQPPFLSARDVHKTYALEQRRLEVLRGVSLDVHRGEFLALRGASGAGKSTLLHLLGGLDTPDEGEIRFEGRDLACYRDADLCRMRNRQVGFIFQAYHLMPDLDALENVALAARMARVAPGEALAKGRHLLERVGLGDRMNHRPTELSGGEQQRVAIARALVNDPALVLADEPTGNLDSVTGEGIIRLLCDLRAERDATLIIATHDARVAEAAPRVVELVDGSIDGTAVQGRAGPEFRIDA
ncbi:MAG TPA: ABC transporter [Verrucomicrobiales bacterium]|nr:ABC transporter [Verrucomicrobiales bacterium]